MKLGYARVSSIGQSLTIQLAALEAVPCDRILSEKVSGTSMDGRDQLHALLSLLRYGDELHVTRLDRLARSVGDLIKIVERIDAAGASLHVIEQPIETKTSAGRLFLTILGAFAAFEHQIRAERQMEGIAKAREENAYGHKPRKPSFNRAHIWELHQAGKSDNQIAKALKCTRGTVFRARKEVEREIAHASREAKSVPSAL